MSRTYRKYVKVGTCTGSNTEYYRERNRKARNMNRQNLRNLMAHHNIEEVSDKVMNFTLPHDDWDEPTDGTHLVMKSDKDFYINDFNYRDRQYGTGLNYWNHRFGKYLKRKH